ncbi:MAG: 50S ribosomal protein L27 [Candidatus Paceibacterota bacterium]
MAHTKAGGSSKNGRDSGPKFLGVKLADGQAARPGMVIVRQRGTKIMAGKNVKVGKDHTLYAMVTGLVTFKDKRKTNFDGRVVRRKIVDVLAPAA